MFAGHRSFPGRLERVFSGRYAIVREILQLEKLVGGDIGWGESAAFARFYELKRRHMVLHLSLGVLYRREYEDILSSSGPHGFS